MPTRSSSESVVPDSTSRDGSLSSSKPTRDPQSEWVSRQVRLMAAAWGRGERISAEEALKQYPDLSSENAVRLVYEELVSAPGVW